MPIGFVGIEGQRLPIQSNCTGSITGLHRLLAQPHERRSKKELGLLIIRLLSKPGLEFQPGAGRVTPREEFRGVNTVSPVRSGKNSRRENNDSCDAEAGNEN